LTGVKSREVMMALRDLLRTVLYSDSDIPLVIKRDTSLKSALQFLKFKAGQRVKLPYSYALTLIREGAAEVDSEQLPAISTVKKCTCAEEKSDELQPLEEDFYLKLALYVRDLKDKARRGDGTAEENYRKIRIAATDLIRLRTLKIAQLALRNPAPLREKMKNMTREEQIFYVSLCSQIATWMSDLSEMIFGEK